MALRRAEATARSFIFAEVHRCGIALPREAYLALSISLAEQGDDGERFARSFSALALVLTAMLEQITRFGRLAGKSIAGQATPSEPPQFIPFGLTTRRRTAIRARDAPHTP